MAFRSFFAELFSLFFLLALLPLYIVFAPSAAFLRSFLPTDDNTLVVLVSCSGRSELTLFILFSSCLFTLPLPFFFACEEETLTAPLGGGDDEVDEDGAEVMRGFGLGLEFISSGSWIIAPFASPSS